MTTPLRRPFLQAASLAALTLLAPLAGAPPVRGEEIKVTVLAVLATDRNTTVDPRVKCIAEEVRKLEPTLTGYRLARTTCKPLGVGRKESFPLVDDETATVSLHHGPDKDHWVGLTVKPPLVGEITYVTICGKFFPIVTRYQTRDRERLILAVMVRPCPKKK